MEGQLDLVPLVDDAGHRVDHHGRARPEGFQQLRRIQQTNKERKKTVMSYQRMQAAAK